MRNSKFGFYVVVSGVMHIILLFSLLTFRFNAFSKKIIIQQAVRVDIVALPDIEKPQKKMTQKIRSSIPDPKKKSKPKKPMPKKKPVLKKKTPQDPTTASKKPDIEKKQEAQKGNLKKKGNQLSKGLNDGDIQNHQKKINIYFTIITGKIKLQWKIPKYLEDQNLHTEIELKIDPSGLILEQIIVKSSKNETFDSSVLQAIRLSTPLPPPPKEIHKLLKDGVILSFP